MVRIIHGTFHQGGMMSNYAGFQCTAISLLAILFVGSNFMQNPSVWTSREIDQVLVSGNIFYEQLLDASGDDTPRYLGHWELPHTVDINGEVINIAYYTDIFYGVNSHPVPLNNFHGHSMVNTGTVNSRTMHSSSEQLQTISLDGSVSIMEAVERATFISDYMLLTIGTTTVSVLRFGDAYFMLDSHARNSCGVSSNSGVSSLFEFKNINELTDFISRNFASVEFNLTPVIVEKQEQHRNQNPVRNLLIAENYEQNLVGETNNSSVSLNTPSNDLNGNNIVNDCSVNGKFTCNCTEFERSVKRKSVDSKCLRAKQKTCGKSGKITKDTEMYENSIKETITAICSCCDKILLPDQVKKVGFPNLPSPFENNSYIQFGNNSTFCSKCCSQLIKKCIPPYCKFNMLDAGEMPACLKNLDVSEKRMISQIQSFMTLLLLPGGQYAEKGLAIHFPLDLNKYQNELLNCQGENFLVVSYGSDSVRMNTIPCRKLVNFHLVKEALKWLRKNNDLYSNFPDIPQSRIELLCEDDSQNFVHSVKNTLSCVPQCSVIPIDYVLPDVDISSILGSPKCFHLPTQFNQPLWIGNVPHGEELAFPTLFPYGKSGLNECRVLPLSTLQYFQSRIYNKDERWRKNIPYLMYAVNHMEQSKLATDIEIQMRIRRGSTITAGNLTSSDHSSDINANSYMFMKNIRGTVAYWMNVLHDLLAMVKCIGPPTLFVTLSADDCHWPELDMLLTGRTYNECLEMPSGSSSMIKDPLLTSLHFERRWKSLFKHIIKGKASPLGKIQDHFARIEYQNRGSPHLHLFLWIADAPNVQTSSSREIVNFIDQIIKTTIPSEHDDKELHDLVSRLQIHHHTATCRKRTACRFGFPRQETVSTHLLQNVDVSSPSNRGRFYETVRSENDIYVNAYNEVILKRWRANMDIQVVSSSHGLAYYVCSYIAKAEPDDLKGALGKVLQDISKNPQGYSLKRQMYLIGNCVLKSRRLSAQEAAARIGHLQLIWKSREVVFLNTRPPSQRFRILKSKAEREMLNKDSPDIFKANIFDYYVDRPDDMESDSLFKFAANNRLSESDTVDVSARSLKRFRLKTLGKIMQRRRNPAVIRTPVFPPDNDNYFYSILMLHFPYRNESALLNGFCTARDAFIQNYENLKLDDLHYVSYLHDVERIIRIIRTTNTDIGAVVAPNTDEGHEDNSELSTVPGYEIMSDLNVPCGTMNCTSTIEDVTAVQDLHNLHVNMLSQEEINDMIHCLNPGQQAVFNVIHNHFVTRCNRPLHMFISGEGGTGKSFLIRTIVEWMRCFTANFISVNPVIVCGPTGVSAKNIHGITLHSALKLPVQHGREPPYKELSNRSLQLLRSQFRNVHTLVIDEISMVSSCMLTFIHRRLCSIKENNENFGGMNVIVIGDFFQLKPVRGDFAFLNTLLWNSFDNYILDVNVRQSMDSSYSQLLSRIRYGEISRGDIEMLMSRLIPDDHEDFIGALRVFPTIPEVRTYNEQKQMNLNHHCVQHNATHEFQSSHSGEEVSDEFIPSDDRDAGGMSRHLVLSVGTRVMLIRNIATDQGLVNGALGFVEGFSFENGELVQVFVKFDDSSIGCVFHNAEHNAICIEPISQEFYHQGRSIYRTQFPLMPAWACTIHKVQGISTDKIVVCLGKKVFAEGQFYVALSRVRTLKGLGILALDPTKVRANADVISFYKNIQLHRKHDHPE